MSDLFKQLLGALVLLVGTPLYIMFFIFWHVIPALALVAAFGALLAVLIWLLTFKILSFQVLWIFCTLFIFVGIVSIKYDEYKK